jgi:phage terminase small subunit
MTLTAKEKTFCQVYVVNGCDGVRAAVAAGYPVKSANAEAARLLTEDSVTNYIAILTTTTETKKKTATNRQIFSNNFYEWLKSKRQ